MTQLIIELGVNWIRPGDNSTASVDRAIRMVQDFTCNTRELENDPWFKLQFFQAEELCTPKAKFMGHKKPMVEELTEVQPSRHVFSRVANWMQSRRHVWGTSVFTHADQDWLLDHDTLLPNLFKVASPDAIDGYMIRRYVAALRRHNDPVLLISTGGCSDIELDKLIQTLNVACANFEVPRKRVYLMHCIAQYPVRQHSMARLVDLHHSARYHSYGFGISSHWPYSGDSIDLFRSTFSAFRPDVLEVHGRLTHDHDCIDVDVSLNPHQAAAMTLALSKQHGSAPDRANVFRTRRAWVARHHIPRGTKLGSHNCVLKRTLAGNMFADTALDSPELFAADDYDKDDSVFGVEHLPTNPS